MTPLTSTPSARARGRFVTAFAAVLLLLGLLTPGVPQLGADPAAAAACPCTIWSSTATPANPSDPDGSAVELGVKFRSDVAGFVTGVRFYKGTANTGTHVGNLWSASGTKLASATFVDETASGWQQVTFSGPVAIAAGTTYVASYYAPNGRYAADSGAFATAGVDNAPLHALANGVDGANGVYRYGTGGGFPSNTWQSANYWVDVVFETTAEDTKAPTVTTRTPADGGTGVPAATAVTATFDEAVSAAEVALSGPAGAVAGTTAYDTASRTVTFQPTAALTLAATYTATVSRAVDAAGNTMAPSTWSFRTASTQDAGCPCSLWTSTSVPGNPSSTDSSAVELGVRFRSDQAGYITGLKFYKGSGNTGTHVGSLWSGSGSLLSSATFVNESSTGWQHVALPAPVAVTTGTDYVASYYAPNGGYAVDNGFFATSTARPPLRAPADGSSSPNGVYRYGASGFPTSSYASSNYWVDVVFATTSKDTVPPAVTTHAPAAGATSIDVGTGVFATFDEAITASSLTFSLLSSQGSAVPATTSYDATSRTATLRPSAALEHSATYTASVSAADSAGNAMGSPVTWSFTTAAAATPPTSTQDGPVLVVAPSGNSFGRYLPEILRAEGLNSFATADLTALTATELAKRDVVVLAETPLTAAQVTVLTNWVNGGGNLIAMRPDKQLAGLLGITAGSTTLADGYLLVNTTSGPGVGITDQTIQYHGPADRYTLNGAAAVATLYSSSTAATSNPAVTMRDVGTSGGQAAAFTYDLARSVVYTRQGNPVWAGLERDNSSPVRSDDMFWGSNDSNGYVNLNKVAIPQADEQQRLLVNVIQAMNQDKKPLPRFWYFPRMAKAVVIGTGDDHGAGGTAGRFDQYDANSKAGCSLVLWSCLRFTSYVYSGTPLSNTAAASYDAKGHELGIHPQNGCKNFTPASLDNDYTTQLSAWRTKYSSVPSPVTNRYHCLVWSDWATQAKVEQRHGIGLDTNYYYWPGSWMGSKPGFMTGSGMPMRFADTDGSVLETYQAATQLTDESGQSYPATPNTLLGNAQGPLGYYGAFTANMHTDNATTFQSDELITSAQTRGVPIISARQMLTWLKGRDASTFTGLSWSGSTLSFKVSAAAGADGANVLLPTGSAKGTLSAVTKSGVAVAYSTQVLKGVEYAVFNASTGDHAATYGGAAAPTATGSGDGGSLTANSLSLAEPAADSDLSDDGVYARPGKQTTSSKEGASIDSAQRATRDKGGASGSSASTAPDATDVEVLSLPDGTATVSWRTKRGAESHVQYGRSASALAESRYDRELVTEHSVVLTGLEPGQTYHYFVRSTSAAGVVSTSSTRSFVQSAAGVADTTSASLRVGKRDAGGYIARTGNGELQLAGDDVQDFDEPELPGRWTTEAEEGGRTVVYGGKMRLDGTRAQGPLVTGPRTLDFRATFTGSDQFVGLAAGVQGPWVMFASKAGQLYASVHDGKTRSDTLLDPELLDAPHRFRVEWTSTGATMSVDDVQVASRAIKATSMRPMARDLKGGDVPLTLDYLRESAHRPSTSYLSRVHDAQQMVTWDRAVWQASVPAGTSLRVSVRTGSRPVPDATWTPFVPLSGSGATIRTEGRYLQYRVELTTTAPSRTPVLSAIGFTHNGVLPDHEGEVQ